VAVAYEPVVAVIGDTIPSTKYLCVVVVIVVALYIYIYICHINNEIIIIRYIIISPKHSTTSIPVISVYYYKVVRVHSTHY